MKVKCVKSYIEVKDPHNGEITRRPFPFTIGKEYEVEFNAGSGCAKILSYSDTGWLIFVSDAGYTGLGFMNMFLPVGRSK